MKFLFADPMPVSRLIEDDVTLQDTHALTPGSRLHGPARLAENMKFAPTTAFFSASPHPTPPFPTAIRIGQHDKSIISCSSGECEP